MLRVFSTFSADSEQIMYRRYSRSISRE